MIKKGDKIDNRYRIIEQIGSGGMANVFLASDTLTETEVALKIMKEELKTEDSNFDNFLDEIKVSSSMVHPNIVSVLNQGVFDGRPYIVIEYVKEQTLSHKLECLQHFSVKESCEIMVQLLDAIDYTHKHGLIHRDIKPQNIFYFSNGTIKLGDFGITVNSKDALTSNSKVIGSVYYLAPEVYLGRPFSVMSDVYAAGITFFQLITGTLPFDSGSAEKIAMDHVKVRMSKPSKITAGISSDIDEIILKATSKNSKDRYKSASEFKSDILKFLAGKSVKKSFFSKLFGK